MSAEGTWNLTIDTPLGKQHAQADLTRSPDGTWRGVARDPASGEEVSLADVTVQGREVTWRQSVTRPMRLNLTLQLTVTGDTVTGSAKAGRLPASKVTGERAGQDGLSRDASS
ncbi:MULTISPECIES: hypothetical protein [unclassified Streptosporangium]|uniref:hypothetical protein n=1 Tax=unclassified Streptosporangium TaxID=2632669 RepID=UPI002E2DA357|nr:MULTISPECIES: hypothetical protein [unclassified Streptosporangium]